MLTKTLKFDNDVLSLHGIMNSGVYQIFCITSGHRYIGSSQNLRRRLNKHQTELRRNQSGHPILQNAWNKYGEDSFDFSILLICSAENLLFYEQRVIDILRSEYNARRVVNSPRGRKLSEQTKLKLRQINLGKKHKPESCEKNRLASLAMWSSPEGREKMLCSHHPVSDETREKLRTAYLQRSPLIIEKIRISLMGRPVSQETREKLRQANIGKMLSLETREKMRIAATGRVDSKYTRKKRCMSQLKRWAMYRAKKESDSAN